ncbi:HET-domain-containing protein [Xylariaceae sp. FL0255]|nr:HET-domain-containing protein [Xylariaceae sp. FL0255]
MRLINVDTLDFKEIADPASEKYAILSHTWTDGQEVTLQDWLVWRHRRDGWKDIAPRSGLKKIIGACNKTKKYGLSLLWVDTNCIDKLSSAELSEAINSMFKWYSHASVCLAYLGDVSTRLNRNSDAESDDRQCIKGKNWTWIGSRTTFCSTIHHITGIDTHYLDGSTDFHYASIASRMSWAASRQTTRVEDMAYSLLGIFDINMPLLYGEGEGAFIRLQEEILKVSTDQSIFAWSFAKDKNWTKFRPHPGWVSFLAPFPSCFRNAGDIKALSAKAIWSMTNLGLSIELPLVATTVSERRFVVLKCNKDDTGYLCIPIMREVDNEFTRSAWPPEPLSLCGVEKLNKPVSIYIPRYRRYGTLYDTLRLPIVPKTPHLLVFINTLLSNHTVTGWITTPGAAFNLDDTGLLSIVRHRESFEGVLLRFSKKGHTEPAFTAIVFSEPDRLKRTRGSVEKSYAYCQLWLTSGVRDLIPLEWQTLYKRGKNESVSNRMCDMLGSLLTSTMTAQARELGTSWDGTYSTFTRTNPSNVLEAISDVRQRTEQLFPGVGYCSVMIRLMDGLDSYWKQHFS